MKKITKIIVSILIAMVCVVGAVGCGGETDKTRTTITYTAWNLGNGQQETLNRKMLKAFETAHPQYKVSIVEAPTSGYDDFILSGSANKNLPDVFMLTNMSFGLRNKFLYDLTAIAEKDADWAKIPAPVEQASRFNGKVFAVPAEMHLHGMYVNENVLDNKNYRGSLAPNLSIQDFKDALAALNDVGSYAALSSESSIIDWYPAAIDEDLGYFTWDGEEYNLDSDAFADALALMTNIRKNKQTYDSWSNAEREASQSTSDMDLFRKNKMAMFAGASYIRNGILYGDEGGTEIIFEGTANDITFVGTPGGRQVIIPDIYGISKTTKNIDGAYLLAKWMSFDPAGILKRIELDTKNEFISLPLTNDEAVIDAYFEKEAFKGLREVFESLDNGIVEPVKIVPGYAQSRWETNTGVTYTYREMVNDVETEGNRGDATIANIFDDIWKNSASVQWATIKVAVNGKANEIHQNAVRQLDQLYPKS